MSLASHTRFRTPWVAIDPTRPAGSRRGWCDARWCVAVTLAMGTLAACEAVEPVGHEMLNAVLWQQHAAEYQALARQSYALALERLDEALADPSWAAALEQHGDVSSLPPAVILDLDETVFDNSRYEARIVTRFGEYSPESFAEWCAQTHTAVVPGASDFLHAAHRRGVAVFYYSARIEALRDCTLATLARLGLPDARSDRVLLRAAGGKSAHRRQVARTHRIVLLVGDSLEDFVAGSKSDAAARQRLIEQHGSRIGRQWIVLPNAMYGHWEALHYNFDYRMPHARKLDRKRDALVP